MAYQTLEQLQQSKAKLHETVVLDENMQLAFWSNQQDRVSVCSDHHTLSLYIQDGYESYQNTCGLEKWRWTRTFLPIARTSGVNLGHTWWA